MIPSISVKPFIRSSTGCMVASWFRSPSFVRHPEMLRRAISECRTNHGLLNHDATIQPVLELMKGLTDIEGIKVGHASDFDALTGCTAILCPAGAVAGVDARGGGTGTQEFDTMSPLHVTDAIHAVVLAGGARLEQRAGRGASTPKAVGTVR